MKILSIMWGCAFGGATKYILALPQMSRYADIEIDTLCINCERWDSHLECLYDIRADIISIKGRHDFTWIAKCKNKIDVLRPSLVFVHGFNGPVVALLCTRLSKSRCKFVCSYHGLYYPPKKSRQWIAPYLNATMIGIYKWHAISVAAVSNYSRKILTEKGVPKDKVVTIYNGIEDNQKDDISEKCVNADHTKVVVGTISRLDPLKGLEYLLEAFQQVCLSIDADLVIVGEGSYKKELQHRCVTLGIEDKVSFPGYKSDVVGWIDSFDIFVLPSLIENHSIALLEAMRAGKAIIATDVGGNTESIVDQKHGLIVPAKNSSKLCAAICQFAASAGLRQVMGSAARERFKRKFTLEISLKNTAQWLMSLES